MKNIYKNKNNVKQGDFQRKMKESAEMAANEVLGILTFQPQFTILFSLVYDL